MHYWMVLELQDSAPSQKSHNIHDIVGRGTMSYKLTWYNHDTGIQGCEQNHITDFNWIYVKLSS